MELKPWSTVSENDTPPCCLLHGLQNGCVWAVLSSYQTQDGTNLILKNPLPRTYTRQTLKHVRKRDAKLIKKVAKAHVVKHIIMKIEDHFDDCGEYISSLKAVELCSLAWTSSLNEDAAPLKSDRAHAQ